MSEHVYWQPELECASRSELEADQLAKLRQQLAHVSERSPFYKRKFAAAGIKSDDIRTLEDVRNIPFTEKDELKESQLALPPWGDFACIEPIEAVRVFQTSGTTGTPVRIMLNRQDWFETFYEQFQHYRCGYGMTEEDVLFVPFNYGLFMAWWGFQTAMERAGLLCVPGGGQSSADRLKAMIDWGATVVCGTPSYLLYLAEMAAKGGPDLAGSGVRKIIAAGEPGANVQATKKALESQWGAECFDDVGSTEISNFGFECQAHEGTHVVESMFLAEVLDTETDEALPDGEVGELVLTNLACTSAPLIRYRMRDLVRFNRQACACGRTFLRLDGGVLGRSDDMFHFAGVNVFPSQIQNLLHGVDELSLEYQLRIPRQGSGRPLTIEVEPAHERLGRPDIERAREHLIETVRYRVGVTPAVEVVEIGSLPRVEGKAKRLIRED
ncbi:MAG: phenylacetate--CoA ligase [Rhodospirillaceae bacterium]|nr:phenylacetate--CoA ligase [Rhodospirillaceae bacterium]